MKFTEAQLEQAFIHLTVSRYTICGGEVRKWISRVSEL
jgi:hypothetical protein